jgi:hypothetical protein
MPMTTSRGTADGRRGRRGRPVKRDVVSSDESGFSGTGEGYRARQKRVKGQG